MAPSAAISPSHRRGCERDFESAKLNGLDPQHYLADALARIRRPSPPAALRNSDLELANAGLDIVWPQLAALAAFTLAFFTISLMRFRTAIVSFQ